MSDGRLADTLMSGPVVVLKEPDLGMVESLLWVWLIDNRKGKDGADYRRVRHLYNRIAVARDPELNNQ